jgi:hypothetical protein
MQLLPIYCRCRATKSFAARISPNSPVIFALAEELLNQERGAEHTGIASKISSIARRHALACFDTRATQPRSRRQRRRRLPNLNCGRDSERELARRRFARQQRSESRVLSRISTVPLEVGWLQLEDVSPMAVFLASDAAALVTGGEFAVTGGDAAKVS